jgi:polar amino acid transport system permease protein
VDLNFLGHWLPLILSGLKFTVIITIGAAVFALVGGLALTLLRSVNSSAINILCQLLIEYIRGVPALVVLFFVYFGLPALGIELNALWASIIGLGVNRAVFLAEIFRAGIEAIPKGQSEAASSLGLPKMKTYAFIVIPQAFRIVLPALVNELIGLTKDSSLASVITVPEVSLKSSAIAQATFRPFEVYIILSGVYVALCFLISRTGLLIERLLAIPSK